MLLVKYLLVINLFISSSILADAWIYEIEYNNFGCSGDALNYNRVSAFLEDTCYLKSSTDGYKYTVSGGSVLRQYFTTPDCTGAATTTKNFPINGCTTGLYLTTRTDPPTEKVGWASMEKVRSIEVLKCAAMESARHLIKLSACVKLPDFEGSYARFIDSTTPDNVRGQAVAASCAGGSSVYDRCNYGDEKYSGIITNPISWTAPTINVAYGPTRVIVSSFSNNWKFAYYYAIEYFNGASYTVGCDNYQSSQSCTIQIPNGISTTNIRVRMKGDTILSNPESFTSGNYQIFQVPVMNDIVIVEKRITSIKFSYSALNSPNSYSVSFNGNTRSECSSTTSCTISSLGAGSNFQILITATNDAGTSATKTSSGVLYPILQTPQLVITQTKGKLVVEYSASGGVDGETLYTTKIDNVNVPGCISIPTLKCTILDMPVEYNKYVTVEAQNDIYTRNNSTQIQFALPVISKIVVKEIRTKSIKLEYSASGSPSSYEVLFNGEVKSQCSNTAACEVTSLTPNTTYSISITATNQAGKSIPITTSLTTYPTVSSPSITTVPSVGQIYVKYTSQYGVPNETLYSVQMNNQPVIGCVSISDLNCTIRNLQQEYSHLISVSAQNDGDSKLISKNVTYSLPKGSNFTNILPYSFDMEVSWSENIGGVDGETFYNLSISFDNSTWKVECENTKDIFCDISNLAPGTLYYLRLTVKNYNFSPLYTYESARTKEIDLEPECDTCINGVCDKKSGICICNEGYTGFKCDIIYENKPPIIIPNPNSPGIIINQGKGTYSFILNSIIERTPEKEEVFSLGLSQLKWNMIKVENQTTQHPTKPITVLMNQWSYSTNQTKVDEIIITFTQFLPIGGEKLSSYPMNFAGEDFNLTMGSLKYQVELKKWDFNTKLNILEIQTKIDTPFDECYDQPGLFINKTKLSGITIQQSDGQFVYGRISKRALIDSIPRSIHVEVKSLNESSTLISTLISYFQENTIIDPDFSLLINSDYNAGNLNNKCTSKKNNKWKVIVGCVVGIFGAVSIAAASAILIRKNKIKDMYNNRLKQKLEKQKSNDNADNEKL